MTNPHKLHDLLFTWWQKAGRILPWREKLSAINNARYVDKVAQASTIRDATFQTYFASSLKRDPYRVIVAEMMLQQTQVDRVLPKYEAWMQQWPKIENLANAELAEVLIFWQGLGYNRRARFLWLLAKEISHKRDGVWPTTEEELRELPGIGKYTARAVMTFGFGMQVGVVDTNVKRILERVVGGVNNERQLKSEKEYFALADELLPPEKADPWNQLLMDFGALICTAKNPKCPDCPLFAECHANQDAITQGFKNYAEYQKAHLSTAKNTKPTVKFSDTNRYFRGRIMDELRISAHSPKKLQEIMEEKYGLLDTDRFYKLLTSLEKEGMLRIKNDLVQIG